MLWSAQKTILPYLCSAESAQTRKKQIPIHKMNRVVLLLGLSLAASALQCCAQSGLPLWTNRFDGPADGYDQANGLAADSSGNVIVTGYITVTNGHSAFGTIKYSSAGAALWTNVFSDISGNGASANAIAVNSNGDVFVTGFSTIISGSSQYATVGYSSAGVPMWTNRYSSGGLGPNSA